LALASLEARLQPPVSKDQPVADRVVSLFLILSICAWFLFIPIDVFHLRLLPPPDLTISILGAALFIRHPFYLGFLFFLVGIGLWLESYASLLALPVVLVFLIVRTFVEEKTLRETLPGYVGYMARVRCRLIPRIW
jgi:protein-S-isoprenylcysteine O-methyltransferase Ste14